MRGGRACKTESQLLSRIRGAGKVDEKKREQELKRAHEVSKGRERWFWLIRQSQAVLKRTGGRIEELARVVRI